MEDTIIYTKNIEKRETKKLNVFHKIHFQNRFVKKMME